VAPDYEKETHDREVQLYILFRLFNLSSLGSTTPFWAHENLVVLTSADLFIFKCVSWNRPRNYRIKLARLWLSNSRSTRDFRNLAKPCPNHTSYPFRNPVRRDTPRSLRDPLPFSALFLYSGFLVFSYYWHFSSFAFLVLNMSWWTIGWRCHPWFWT